MKGASFTAFLNEDLEHSNQTQLMKKNSNKDATEIGIMATEDK
jgi:hypothetical protein